MPFDLKTKTLFLTYSQCEATHDELYEFLSSKLDIQYAVVGRERHADEGRHLHAYVKLKQSRRFRNCKELDLGESHPNITSARNNAASITYAKKDGDYKEFGDNNSRGAVPGELGVRDGEGWFDYFERQHLAGTILRLII